MFISKVEYERLQSVERDSDAQERRHKKTLKELKAEHKKEVQELTVKNEKLTSDLEVMTAKHKALDDLNNSVTDAAAKSLESEQREKTVKRREDNADKRETALDKEESRHYKSGYEDGVADGLRKGIAMAEDDRHNATLIAMASAVSHSDSEATGKIAGQMIAGMETSRAAKQLPATTPKKK